ncbi:ThuA domain-containing protein [Gemmata sp.]|uniref:ThuA domain-containing protein n=1 Tax=Gemmata sp. TaxID=1914242 RepID=UPI003F70F7CF
MRFAFLLALLFTQAARLAPAADEPPALPNGWKLEEQPADPKATKIVLIAGSSYYKAGEHEYVAGITVLADLLKQTPGVAPVIAIDWPTNPETLKGAKAVVFLFDGGDKHGILKGEKGNRLAEIGKLLDGGAGFVQLHQTADYPKDLGDRARALVGGAWEAKHSLRAHWVSEFKDFPEHPVTRGVTPFTIDDGYLWKLKFVPEMKGVTPLLRTVNPKSKDDPKANDAIISWAYDRPEGGRSFVFTGGHLHKSFAEEGYRRFLTNGVLWAAGVDVPKDGAPVKLDAADLPRYLAKPPAKKEK